MPWNVGVDSKTGECCDCEDALKFGPCKDCNEDEPKTPCECPGTTGNSKAVYSNPSACETDFGPCYKCVSAGPCNQGAEKDLVGSFGCYFEVKKECPDYGGCAFFDELEENECNKIDKCDNQPDECFGTPACYKTVPKTCSDYSFLTLAEAQSKCGEEDGNPLNCINIELPACQSLTCYSCKLCADFGLSGFPFCTFPKVPQAVTKCGQTCYDCVDPDCDCEEAKGYFNSPPANTDPDCLISRSKTGVLPFPCSNKLCHYLVCGNCSDLGYYDDSQISPPDPCFTYPEKPICFGWQFDSGGDECDGEICYDKVEKECKDFTQEGSGDQCASGEGDCTGDTFFDDTTGGCKGGDCPTLDCPGVCRQYCGWKVTGVSFEPDGSPSCQTTANLNVINPNCTSGSASSVATQNVSGFFTVTCPSGDPCEGKVPSTSWPPSPGFGASSPVTFSWEDCGISPADGVVTVTLERCKEGCV